MSKVTASAAKMKKERTPVPQIYRKHFITPLRGAVYEMASVDIEVRRDTSKHSDRF